MKKECTTCTNRLGDGIIFFYRLKIFSEFGIRYCHHFSFSELKVALMARCFSKPQLMLVDPDSRMSHIFIEIDISDEYNPALIEIKKEKQSVCTVHT